MPRCLSCDKNLSDFEATRKHAETGEYLDLCNNCLRDVLDIQDIPYVNSQSNVEYDSIIDDIFDYGDEGEEDGR